MTRIVKNDLALRISDESDQASAAAAPESIDGVAEPVPMPVRASWLSCHMVLLFDTASERPLDERAMPVTASGALPAGLAVALCCVMRPPELIPAWSFTTGAGRDPRIVSSGIHPNPSVPSYRHAQFWAAASKAFGLPL